MPEWKGAYAASGYANARESLVLSEHRPIVDILKVNREAGQTENPVSGAIIRTDSNSNRTEC